MKTPQQEEITYGRYGLGDLWPTVGGGVVACNERGHIIGYLRWRKEGDGREFMIDMIKVERPYRRRGIATRLLSEAQKIEPRVRHSSIRTEDGDLWAKSTGDPVPVRYWHPRHFDLTVDDVRHIIHNEASLEVA